MLSFLYEICRIVSAGTWNASYVFLITNRRLGQRDMVESWELVWLTDGINTSQNGTLATLKIFVLLFFQDDVGGIRSRLPPLRSLCAGYFQSISTLLEGFLREFLSRQDGLTARASEQMRPQNRNNAKHLAIWWVLGLSLKNSRTISWCYGPSSLAERLLLEPSFELSGHTTQIVTARNSSMLRPLCFLNMSVPLSNNFRCVTHTAFLNCVVVTNCNLLVRRRGLRMRNLS